MSLQNSIVEIKFLAFEWEKNQLERRYVCVCVHSVLDYGRSGHVRNEREPESMGASMILFL